MCPNGRPHPHVKSTKQHSHKCTPFQINLAGVPSFSFLQNSFVEFLQNVFENLLQTIIFTYLYLNLTRQVQSFKPCFSVKIHFHFDLSSSKIKISFPDRRHHLVHFVDLCANHLLLPKILYLFLVKPSCSSELFKVDHYYNYESVKSENTHLLC